MAQSPFVASNSPPNSFAAVTPSDTGQINGAQFLRIGVGGNLALKGLDGSTATIAVVAGEYVPFGAGFVMATGTTATGIVAFS